jgi:chromosome segregation ATPase
MSADGVPTIATLTTKVQELNRVIRALEEDLQKAGDEAADTESTYRSQLATVFRRLREEGRSATESETLARGQVVSYSRDRDAKAHKVKVLFEKIEDRRQEKASLHALLRVIGGGDTP